MQKIVERNERDHHCHGDHHQHCHGDHHQHCHGDPVTALPSRSEEEAKLPCPVNSSERRKVVPEKEKGDQLGGKGSEVGNFKSEGGLRQRKVERERYYSCDGKSDQEAEEAKISRVIGLPMVDNLQSNGFDEETETSSQTVSLVTSDRKQTTRSRSNTDKTESGFGVSLVAAEEESDSDTAPPAPHPLQQERTRQKKFVKNFKHLQEEVVVQRISCALVGDILLQGHLYVTENYLAFHSNVFGYVTRIQLSMNSVTAINKEKTAKIIPNAVAVSTQDEVHTFTSFISRDATYSVMTKAWRRALARKNSLNLNGTEDALDGQDNNRDYESTDSDNSTNQDSSNALSHRDTDKKYTNPVQRMTMSPGKLFYQAQAKGSRKNHPRAHTFKPEVTTSHTRFEQLVQYLLSTPTSMLLLITLILLLILLFFSSTYLVLRLDNIQEKVDFAFTSDPSHLQQLASWQSLLHSHSSETVLAYLNTNLEQISKVRESLEKLSNFLNTESKRDDKTIPK